MNIFPRTLLSRALLLLHAFNLVTSTQPTRELCIIDSQHQRQCLMWTCTKIQTFQSCAQDFVTAVCTSNLSTDTKVQQCCVHDPLCRTTLIETTRQTLVQTTFVQKNQYNKGNEQCVQWSTQVATQAMDAAATIMTQTNLLIPLIAKSFEPCFWNTPAPVSEALQELHRIADLYATTANRLLESLEHGLTSQSSTTLRRTIFEKIYEQNVWRTWSTDETKAQSGPGSDLLSGSVIAAAEILRTERLVSLGVGSVLDVGCGDISWLPTKTKLCRGSPVRYIGIDIVSSLISNHVKNFAEVQHCNFVVLDATSETVPKADLVLVKDVLFHLSLNRGVELLRRVTFDSSCKYVAITLAELSDVSNPEGGVDKYHGRMTNVQVAPYSLPTPLKEFGREGRKRDEWLGLWECGAVQEALRKIT